LKRDADDAISKRALPAKVLPSLNRSDTDDLSVACLLQQLWTQGFSCVPPSPQKNGITELPFYPFERQPYWNESLASQEARRRPNREKHPHVAELRPSVKSADVFAAELSFDQHAEPYLADHIVQGVIVVPAAAQIETLLNTADLAATSPDSPRSILEDVEFRRAITLPDDADSVDIQLDVYSDQGYFRIASRRRTDKSHEWLEHTRGRLNRIDGQRPLSSISLHSIRERLKNCIPAGVVFQSLLEMGLKLGPSFQGITEVWVDGREALSRIQLPAALRADSERFKFHPAVLDCMLQTAAVNGLCRESTSRIVIDGSLFLPHRAGRIELYRSPGVEPFWCHSILERKLDDEFEVSVWAYDETGKPLAALEELIARRVPGSPAVAATGNNVLYDHIWQASDAVEADRGSIAGTWMVLANERDCAISNAIIEAISTHCAGVIVCRTGDAFQRVARNEYHVRPCNPTDFSLVLQNAGDEARICGVVNLWMCRTEIDEAAIEAATHLGPAAITYLIQSLDDAAQWESDHPKVCLVTLGAQSVELTDAGSLCPPSALLTGFGRVLTSERPGLKILVVDLSRVPGAPEIANLISELLGNHPYQELALRDGRRYVKSIKARVQNSPQATNFDVESTPLALNIKTPGSLDSISWEEQRQCVPGLDEIEIAVKSCGLNFKDVALATGLVSGAVFARGHTQGQIGMDCAGIVSRVGTKVTTLRVGDHVMGIARGALANRVIADAHHVVRMPTSLTFSEAAGIPLVFLTAKLALERLARIEPDEVVLIHAAAGGVGLAAVQFVHRRGGKVIATAGSPTKVDFLKTLGVSHVFDSRKEDFREKVMEVTGGRGADVVLNSLSGRSLIQGLRSLASFGRFIEIGKVDIVENRQLALQQFAENRSYFCLDVDQWLVGKKREVQQVLAECAADLEANRLRCLPVTKFGIEQTADAFRYLAEARQIGKVVIDIPGAGTVQAIPSPLRRLDETGWYIVSGGTRGYGFAAASWLVDRGVKNLALLSRRGIEGATESGQVESLIQMGINIVALQCDVSDHQAVTSVCDDLRRSKPIHGIIHAATVLDDAPISFLNHDRFASVIRSKASGAWNLHVATRTDNIKFYLMFSSISSVVGTPGQANYAAANAYLDTFVHYLRGLGIPAFVINWGVLDDIGMVSRASIEQRQKILNQGIKAFGQSEVFRLLETIVASDSPSVIAARIDWNSPNSDWLINRFPGIRENSASRAANAKDSDSVSLHERLRVAQPESHADILASAIFNIATKLTGAPSEEIDLELRLDRMGMDSLNAVQLSSWIEQALGLAIPVVQIMRGPSSSELARTLLARIKPAIEADSDRCSPQNNSKSLLRCWRRNPDAAWRILCFPYSGGTGDVFAAWADIVPADAEVWSIDLPTFDGPDGAVLQLPTEEVYAWVAGELQSYFDRSVVFYGHSVGAWFAVEVARHLRATSGLEPELLALGGLLTPDAIRSLVPTNGDHLISDSAVNSAMRMLQYQDVLLTDSIATSQMKELMRRDLWLGSRQDLSKLRVPENVPLLIFGGSDDPLPTIEKDIAAHTTAPTGIQIESVRGGHLFVDDALARAHIVRTIVARIATQSKANTIYGGSRT
jgi:NADPH:quinone reductase-like Zn-dependent oxidoreductase/surfactin synthase thioesterase subunit/acyl carrier protein